jgi:hypothetical protein
MVLLHCLRLSHSRDNKVDAPSRVNAVDPSGWKASRIFHPATEGCKEMSVFPFDDLKVGDVTPVKCRRVRFRGELESDAEFGQWQNETVSHLQRDPKSPA